MGSLAKKMMIVLMCITIVGCASARQSQLRDGKQAFQSGEYNLAFQQLLPLAQKGDSNAQYAIGYMYYYGKGVKKNPYIAFYWIHQSAQQKNQLALNALAAMNQNAVLGTNSEKVVKHAHIKKQSAKDHRSSCNANKYAIQLFSSMHVSHATSFVSKHPKSRMCKVKHHKPANAFVVLYGCYKSHASAEDDLKQLPKGWLRLKPWVRHSPC